MRKSKISSILALLMCIILLTVACAQSTPNGTSSSPQAASDVSAPESTATAGEKVIKLICSSGGSGKSLAGAVESFNAEHAGKINVQADMIAQESLLETMMLQFISGNSSYDLLSTVWVPATREYLAPLNDYLTKDNINVDEMFGAGVMSVATVDGTYRGLPYRSQTYPVFYRTDLFKEAGLNPPTTLDEIVDCARKLTVKNADGTIARYGTSLKMQSPPSTVETFSDVFMPLGGYFLTEDLQHASPTLKSQLAYDVMKAFKTIQDEKLCPDPLSFTYDDNVVGMQTGIIAFSIESSARAPLMEDKEKSQVAGLFDYATLTEQPIGSQPPSNWCSIWYVGIDQNSQNKDEAWEFVKWSTSLEQQNMMAYDFSNGPTVLSIYDDPKYQAFNKSAAAVKEQLQVLPRDYLPVSQTSELQQIIHDEMQLYMLGNQDEVTTGQNMYDKIEAVMTKG